jgi:hypothetical protein
MKAPDNLKSLFCLIDPKFKYPTSPFSPTYSASNTVTITTSQFGLTSFSNGVYYFEIRFIGHRSIFPVCVQYNITTL